MCKCFFFLKVFQAPPDGIIHVTSDPTIGSTATALSLVKGSLNLEISWKNNYDGNDMSLYLREKSFLYKKQYQNGNQYMKKCGR